MKKVHDAMSPQWRATYHGEEPQPRYYDTPAGVLARLLLALGAIIAVALVNITLDYDGHLTVETWLELGSAAIMLLLALHRRAV